MKAARLAVAGIAIAAGFGAMLLVGSGNQAPPPPPVEIVAEAPKGPPLVEVLTANAPIPIGGTLTEANIGWRQWPQDSAGPYFITKASRPNALKEVVGAISRLPLQQGEPVNQSRLIQGERSGFMAAILPEGMRAVAVKISTETGVSGFILPNDRVDVLLTRRDKAGGQDSVVSQILLANIRVLAIDQTVQERDGEKVVVGSTATLELTPPQTETMALAKQLGEISLALRSLAEGPRTAAADQNNPDLQQRGGTMTIVRYGVPVQVPMFGR